MSCNCPNPNPCPTPQTCLCGIIMEIYDTEGNLLESLDSGGYAEPEGTRFYFNDSDIFPVGPSEGVAFYIEYNENSWGIWYQQSEEALPSLISSFSTTSNCPISSCDWVNSTVGDCNCLVITFDGPAGAESYNANTVDQYNSNNVYQFQVGEQIYYIWFSPEKGWSITANGYGSEFLWPQIAYTDFSGSCPNSNEESFAWVSLIDGVTISTLYCDPIQYKFKTKAIECECCDEKIILTITHADIGEEVIINGSIVTDEYGNGLTKNGKSYYSFVLNIDGEDVIYYLVFDGEKWIVTDSSYINGNLSYPIYTAAYVTTDCPYGYYYPDKPFERFWVRGECFDCCDYYAPRNRNLLKKKKAIFVDEISSIKNKEIFGMKCGPEWSDLFKKHLIFDVLWCLPYGVLCDDEEQCLINNLSENCNC